MTDTTPTIATTTLAPRVARAVDPAQVQRLPHGSIIIHNDPMPMPLGSDVTRLEREDAPQPQLKSSSESTPATPEVDEPKPRRRKRLAVRADPVAPAPVETAVDVQSLAAEAHRVIGKLAEHLSLGVGARPHEVLAAFEALLAHHNETLDALDDYADGHIPMSLTFPHAFTLGYQIIDTLPTTEEQERLVKALRAAFGLGG